MRILPPIPSPELDLAEQLIAQARTAPAEEAAVRLRSAARLLLLLRQVADLVPRDK